MFCKSCFLPRSVFQFHFQFQFPPLCVTAVRRYELLVGETPFGRGSPKATMALIAETTKDPYFPSYLSTYAIDIIKRLLTRDQAARLVH